MRIEKTIGPKHIKNNSKYSTIIVLNCCAVVVAFYMVIEFVFGIIVNSIALISDSIHMLSDLISIIMASIAIYVSKIGNNTKKTYGYSRFEILVGFINALFLIFVCGIITYEAIGRILSPTSNYVDAKIMLPVAAIGLVVNIVILLIIHFFTPNTSNEENSSNKKSLLLEGVSLHIISDILGSFVAVISAITIYYTSWYHIDPILSIIIVVLLVNSSLRVIKNCSNIFLESAPKNLNVLGVKKRLERDLEYIKNVHHIHLWMLNEEENIITLHVVVSPENQDKINTVISETKKYLAENFDISHSTVQVEISNSSKHDTIN